MIAWNAGDTLVLAGPGPWQEIVDAVRPDHVLMLGPATVDDMIQFPRGGTIAAIGAASRIKRRGYVVGAIVVRGPLERNADMVLTAAVLPDTPVTTLTPAGPIVTPARYYTTQVAQATAVATALAPQLGKGDTIVFTHSGDGRVEFDVARQLKISRIIFFDAYAAPTLVPDDIELVYFRDPSLAAEEIATRKVAALVGCNYQFMQFGPGDTARAFYNEIVAPLQGVPTLMYYGLDALWGTPDAVPHLTALIASARDRSRPPLEGSAGAAPLHESGEGGRPSPRGRQEPPRP
jgi:hypothetical protein